MYSSNLYFEALFKHSRPGNRLPSQKIFIGSQLTNLLVVVNTHLASNETTKYIMYLDNEFLAIGLRSYANYSIDLQAIIDFPTESYSVGNLIHSEVIRTMANCMQSDIYTDPTATISHKSPKPRKN